MSGETPERLVDPGSAETADDHEATTDITVSGYFPEERSVSAAERRRMREHYGRVRTFFKTNPTRYVGFQRRLNQARIGTTYDRYLSRSLQYALLATLVGVLVGGGIAVALDAVGVLATLTSPVQFPGDVGEFVVQYRLVFAGAAIATASALILGLGTWSLRLYLPRYRANERGRRVDLMLPHAISYMYALSRGGMNVVEVVDSMADADDAYPEVAEEFDTVRRDVDVFGADLTTALRNTRNVTPSETLERFIDDLLSVLESGGEVSVFFEEQSQKYLREAKERQEYFLETLSLLSELFIFGFIAAPLFVVVTLMVISFIGGETLTTMTVLIYVGLPLGMVGFLLLVDILSAPYVQPGAVIDVDALETDGSTAAGDPRLTNYRRTQRRKAIRAAIRNPLRAVNDRPALSLYVTVPLAVAAVALTVTLGYARPTLAAMTTAPIATTTLLVVVPLLVVSVPLAVFHERRRVRQDNIVQRFPDTLNVLSSANAMGVSFSEALALVSRYSTGVLAEELRKVRNDIEWNQDPRRALLAFAARLKVPHLSRTIKLIADGGRSSDDLSRVLSIAAEDTRNRARLERSRVQAMNSYIAIVVIGFLVYLLVILLIDAAFLERIATIAGEQGPESRGAPISFTNVPIETYRALFFHSVLIQGFGAGLLAGKLSDNDALTGLKYSIGLVLLSVAAFLLV